MHAQCSVCRLRLCRSVPAQRTYSTNGVGRRFFCPDTSRHGVGMPKYSLREEGLARLIGHETHPRRRARRIMDTADNVIALRSPLVPGLVEGIEVHPPSRVALFTRHTLASYLDLHVNTIDRLVKRGEIPAYRVSGKMRFYPEDVERYIRDHREVL